VKRTLQGNYEPEDDVEEAILCKYGWRETIFFLKDLLHYHKRPLAKESETRVDRVMYTH